MLKLLPKPFDLVVVMYHRIRHSLSRSLSHSHSHSRSVSRSVSRRRLSRRSSSCLLLSRILFRASVCVRVSRAFSLVRNYAQILTTNCLHLVRILDWVVFFVFLARRLVCLFPAICQWPGIGCFDTLSFKRKGIVDPNKLRRYRFLDTAWFKVQFSSYWKIQLVCSLDREKYSKQPNFMLNLTLTLFLETQTIVILYWCIGFRLLDCLSVS